MALALEAGSKFACRAIGRVKGATQKGRRLGRWLTREEAGQLLRDREGMNLKEKRDRAILCLLGGAGLRREELARLTCAHLEQREGRWVVLDLAGKRIRTVPIPGWAKVAVDRWMAAAEITEGPRKQWVGKRVPRKRRARVARGQTAEEPGLIKPVRGIVM
jgi:site-specific recombinase XerC